MDQAVYGWRAKIGVLTPPNYGILSEWGEVLPEDLLFAFVVNLHVKLRDKVNADDPYLKLLLYFAFPPASAPGKLYLESPKLELRGYE